MTWLTLSGGIHFARGNRKLSNVKVVVSGRVSSPGRTRTLSELSSQTSCCAESVVKDKAHLFGSYKKLAPQKRKEVNLTRRTENGKARQAVACSVVISKTGNFPLQNSKSLA